MNWNAAEKWINALKSGKYQLLPPDSLLLRIGDRFDILGVLCDLPGVPNWELSDPEEGVYSMGGEDGTLPTVIRLWADTKTDNLEIPLKLRPKLHGQLSIACAFDKGVPLTEIIQFIEAHWSEL